MTRSYPTPLAFKTALDERLRNQAKKSGRDITRLRQILVLERFLVRAFDALPSSAVLKGGFALELRLNRTRTTRDVDLCVGRTKSSLLERLRTAARADAGDWLSYEVRLGVKQPELLAEGLKYGGGRFVIEPRLAGRLYGSRFGLDVVIDKSIEGATDTVAGTSLLTFLGLPQPMFRAVSIETHVAEKLHAYTLPRARPNSRVKDLPDLALLSTIRDVEAKHLRRAIEATYAHRSSHPIPAQLAQPPASWSTPYARMVRLDGLPWPTLDDVFTSVREFVDPVLSGHNGIWRQRHRTWT
jgi:hypothetical protein